MRFKIKIKPLYFSFALTYLLMLISILATKFNFKKAFPFLILSFVVGFMPYLIIRYIRYRKLKAMEEIFPEFLRGLAEAQRSGINLAQAIINASSIDYGALNPEIKKMAYQLSWGVPLPKVLRMFASRVKDSDFLRRSIAIIIEAYQTGGDIAEVMDRVAENARILKDLEADRKARFAQQVAIMYAIFVVFIAIILSLNKILLLLFSVTASPEAQGTAIFGFTLGALDPDEFRSLFLNMLIIQSIFIGLISGLIGEGNLVAGIKHVLIMLSIAFIAFSLFIPSKMLILNIEEPYGFIEPGSTYVLTGYVLDSDGQPASNANVFITLGNTTYTTLTDMTGMFQQIIKVPDKKGTYNVHILVKTEDAEASENIPLVVGG